MVFSSMLFLWIFLPLVLAAYYISPGKIRNGILVFFSLLFYAWGEPLYVFLMLFSVAVNFTGGILIEKYQTRKKKILVATLIINLGLLGYFKYFGTLTEAITGLFSADGTGTTLFQVALPIGISFYTFQALSYVIDVYRGEVPAQHNFWHMLLYISFFPQLIAGPIVKYRDIAAQITGRKETIRKFAAGIMRFCWGLGKKVLLANYPYTAGSVQEFWHRWHISLSSWFRDYVYIPLGGNRKGAACTYRNLLIVFFLTGMWHGAGIAFILWGLYHGLFLILERVWLGKKLEKLPGIVGWGYTVTAVFFGWILFRAENISLFFTYVRNMFVAHGGTILLSAYLDSKMIFLIVVGVLFAGVLQKIYEKVRVHSAGKIPVNGIVTVPRMIACLVIFWLSVAALVNNSYNPFIYFRF